MSNQEASVTGQQVAEAQTALREALGLPVERFSLPTFVGMVSDEIEQLREQGKTDEEIAKLISKVAGVDLSAAQIGTFYASPEARGHR